MNYKIILVNVMQKIFIVITYRVSNVSCIVQSDSRNLHTRNNHRITVSNEKCCSTRKLYGLKRGNTWRINFSNFKIHEFRNIHVSFRSGSISKIYFSRGWYIYPWLRRWRLRPPRGSQHPLVIIVEQFMHLVLGYARTNPTKEKETKAGKDTRGRNERETRERNWQ